MTTYKFIALVGAEILATEIKAMSLKKALRSF